MKRKIILILVLFFISSFSIIPTNANESNMIGKPAPAFTLLDLNGNKVSLSDYKGKVVILDFWATWCPPCVREIPHFIELYKEHKDKGLSIVGISVDRQGVSVVKAFNQKYKINYQILMADSQVTSTYGNIRGIPTTFVIDPAGNIQRMYVGYRDKAVFESDIKTLLPDVKLAGTEQKESETSTNKYVAELNNIGIAGRPEIENAAPYYIKAIELYIKKPDGLNVKSRRSHNELTAQEKSLLTKWVQDNSKSLEQLQLGSRKQYCWFIQTGRTLKINSHLKEIRELAFILEARANLQAEKGNINSVINDIVTLYKFGTHISEGPKQLIEKLMGIAIKGISTKTAFNVIDKIMVNSALMKNLEDRFKQLTADYDKPFDIQGEKIFMQQQVENEPSNRFYKRYLSSTLEYLDIIAAMPPWKLHNEEAALKAKTNPWVETLAPAIARAIQNEYRSKAELQALITTLAILRYYSDKNGYPETLSQLISAGYIKELPIDPFSDKPLVYKRTQDSFILYSYGADFDDDGGQHSKWDIGIKGGDQVFWPVEKRL